MYYIDNLTYRQIADIEKRNIKSIYESVQTGKKKFLKYLDKHPNKFKFMKGHHFVQLNTHSSDTFLLLCKHKPLYQLRQDALAERQIIGIKFGLLPKRQ